VISAAAALASLCSCETPTAAPSQPSASADAAAVPSSAAVAASGAVDRIFTIRYRADRTLNPITGTDPDNMALAPLMYESLFVLNSKLEAEKVLCEECSTPDGINYTITLKSGIAMSDGSTLTAADVKYTLSMARQTGRFTGRLKIIDSVSAADNLTVNITLKYADYMFPKLLDVPVIKANSIDQNHPAGSGPYYYTLSDNPSLTALSGYRHAVPLPVITLKDVTDDQLSVDFSSQAIDFFWDDPADSSDIIIRSDHEIRFYDTTVLEFIGFNAKNAVLANPDIRHALGLSIDRAAIIDTVYSNHAVSAPLVLSPKYGHYDTAWEPKVTDALGEISAIFIALNMDTDSEGYLGLPDGGGNITPINLTMIVNKDNTYKVQVAQLVAEAIRSVGINVTLVPLTWNAYMTALENGAFDLFLGDISLPADYDLTALLSSSGALDYGNVGDASYVEYIHAFLASPDDDTQKASAKALCDYIYTQAPIVPILYREFAVHSNRNVVIGLDPTQSSLFYGFSGWRINLG
jgi:ABC-type transport system substrate-binding protein